MSDPFTMLAVGSAATSFVGSIFGAEGASQKAEAEAQQFAMRSQIAKKNAEINRQNSNWTIEAGGYNAMREGLTTGFTIGKQKTAQAASGFDVNSGSPEAVRDSTQRLGRMDQERIITESSRKAKDFRNQADMNELEATMDTQAATNAQKAGKISYWSTLLGGAGSVADKWLKAGSSFSSGSSGITTYGSNFEPTGFYPT